MSVAKTKAVSNQTVGNGLPSEPMASSAAETPEVPDYAAEAGRLRTLEKALPEHRSTVGEESLAKELEHYVQEDSFYGIDLGFADPAFVARALHRIPNDARVAQLLVPLKELWPADYDKIAFMMDLQSPSSSAIGRRDRIEKLMESVVVTDARPLSASEKVNLKSETLGVLADAMKGNDLPDHLNSIIGKHGDVVIRGVIQSDDKKFLLITVSGGERVLTAAEDHPVRNSEQYRLNKEHETELSSNCEESVDADGNLILRVYLPEGIRYQKFDQEGKVVEFGYPAHQAGSNDPESITKISYDSSGKEIKRTQIDGGRVVHETETMYDTDGNTAKEIVTDNTFLDSTFQRITEYKDGRVTREVQLKDGKEYVPERLGKGKEFENEF